jgi:hypothetical protein
MPQSLRRRLRGGVSSLALALGTSGASALPILFGFQARLTLRAFNQAAAAKAEQERLKARALEALTETQES